MADCSATGDGGSTRRRELVEAEFGVDTRGVPEMHTTEALQGCNASRKDALRTRRAAWGKYDAASKMQQGRRKEIEERG